jgi:hypothetical protein
LANAPDELIKAINLYSEHDAEFYRKCSEGDIFHYHNQTPPEWAPAPNQVIQYHSEPFRCNLHFPGKKLVLAQYHALLAKFSDCIPVRNVINFESYPLIEIKDKLRVGYSPSVKTRVNQYYDKGYVETKRILQRLKQRYPSDFDYDIITDASLEECIKRKSRCNVIIDECVTGSYHRSGLEGLALGKLTICYMKDILIEQLYYIINDNNIPFQNVKIDNLENYIDMLIGCNITDIINCGNSNRNWMETYWHPKDIVNEYIQIYKELLNAN